MESSSPVTSQLLHAGLDHSYRIPLSPTSLKIVRACAGVLITAGILGTAGVGLIAFQITPPFIAATFAALQLKINAVLIGALICKVSGIALVLLFKQNKPIDVPEAPPIIPETHSVTPNAILVHKTSLNPVQTNASRKTKPTENSKKNQPAISMEEMQRKAKEIEERIAKVRAKEAEEKDNKQATEQGRPSQNQEPEESASFLIQKSLPEEVSSEASPKQPFVKLLSEAQQLAKKLKEKREAKRLAAEKEAEEKRQAEARKQADEEAAKKAQEKEAKQQAEQAAKEQARRLAEQEAENQRTKEKQEKDRLAAEEERRKKLPNLKESEKELPKPLKNIPKISIQERQALLAGLFGGAKNQEEPSQDQQGQPGPIAYMRFEGSISLSLSAQKPASSKLESPTEAPSTHTVSQQDDTEEDAKTADNKPKTSSDPITTKEFIKQAQLKTEAVYRDPKTGQLKQLKGGLTSSAYGKLVGIAEKTGNTSDDELQDPEKYDFSDSE